MAEQFSNETPRRYDETTAPQNPPNSVLSKEARRAAVWSYFAPLVVLFLVVGVALVYWANRPAHSQTKGQDRAEVGTVGSTEGGFDPHPRPDTTRDEIKFRADDLGPITHVNQLRDVNARTMSGRRVSIDNAEVDSTNGNTVWVRDGDAKFAVIAPDATPSIARGTKVSINGRIEADDNGATRIVADRIQAR